MYKILKPSQSIAKAYLRERPEANEVKAFSDFIGVYPVVKILRFELRPIGKTGEWIKRNGVIEADEKVAEDAPVAKELIDKYHKICIKESLEGANYNWEELKDVCIAYMAKKTQETNTVLRKKYAMADEENNDMHAITMPMQYEYNTDDLYSGMAAENIV